MSQLKYCLTAKELFEFVFSFDDLQHVEPTLLKNETLKAAREAHRKIVTEHGTYYTTTPMMWWWKLAKEKHFLYDPIQIIEPLIEKFGACCAVCRKVRNGAEVKEEWHTTYKYKNVIPFSVSDFFRKSKLPFREFYHSAICFHCQMSFYSYLRRHDHPSNPPRHIFLIPDNEMELHVCGYLQKQIDKLRDKITRSSA